MSSSRDIVCHYCRKNINECKCFERGLAIMPAKKDPQRFTTIITCAYCGNFVPDTKIGCTNCKGEQLCKSHHLPKPACGCDRPDELKSILQDNIEIWNEKDGPLNPDNLQDKMSSKDNPDGDDGVIRTFESGATRDTSADKHDPEGFISPLVIDRYNEYMHKNRLQTDNSLRASDNWQKGMGFAVFMKSIWRHFLDVWKLHRGYKCIRTEKGKVLIITMEEALCGLLFNTMGYLHEYLQRDKISDQEKLLNSLIEEKEKIIDEINENSND